MVRIKRLLDLFASLVALLCLAPVMAYLDLPLLLVALLALPAGIWCDRRDEYPLPAWLATLVAIAGMLFYAVQITSAEVALPVVHALVVLMAVRLLSPKQGRDYLQIFVLALFILAGTSLIHLEIGFIVYLILLVFSVTLGLVLLTVHVTDRNLAMTRQDLVKLVKVGLILPAVSLVLMVVFFVVLPRTQYPLWNFLNPAAQGMVGLSDTVQPGSFARISSTRNLAFRAEGPELAPEDRYWRALVLNRPQEGRWVRAEPPEERLARIEGPAPLKYVIFPEPRNNRYLVTLDQPTMISGIRHEQTVDRMFLARRDIDRRVRFEVRSSPGASLLISGIENLAFYLDPPPEASQRMRQAAEHIRQGGQDPGARLAALADFFRERQLSYAQDDLPSGPNAIDAFLFEKRRGYCEFFASAYIAMARLTGIPARLVGGYYGGDYNALGGYYLVSEDAAHVWVEVFVARRWQRVDPSQWAVNVDTTLGARGRNRLGTFRQLADNLNYRWVQAVVVFDLQQQIELFREAGSSLRNLRSLRAPQGWWKAAAGMIAAGLLASLIFSRRSRSKEERVLEKFRARIVSRYGVEAMPPGSGLEELGDRLDNDLCREFARIYYGAVFRDRTLTPGELVELKDLLKRI